MSLQSRDAIVESREMLFPPKDSVVSTRGNENCIFLGESEKYK